MFSSHQQDWIRIQDQLKGKLVLKDDFTWTIFSKPSSMEERVKTESLRYIGGVDVSFLKRNASLGCGALVVLDAYNFEVVHEDYEVVQLDIPYVPGFLAFREAPILLRLLDKMKCTAHSCYPQLLMVDGNGLLLLKLHHVDGLTQSGVRRLLEARETCENDMTPLIGTSGRVWGMALRSTTSSSKPIYVSVGHRISLNSAVMVVRSCCKYRLPEPIRLADTRSREFLQKLQKGRAL